MSNQTEIQSKALEALSTARNELCMITFEMGSVACHLMQAEESFKSGDSVEGMASLESLLESLRSIDTRVIDQMAAVNDVVVFAQQEGGEA